MVRKFIAAVALLLATITLAGGTSPALAYDGCHYVGDHKVGATAAGFSGGWASWMGSLYWTPTYMDQHAAVGRYIHEAWVYIRLMPENTVTMFSFLDYGNKVVSGYGPLTQQGATFYTVISCVGPWGSGL